MVMAIPIMVRPDLMAHRYAISLPYSEIVRELTTLIGKKLTAYVAGVKDVRALDRWMEGSESYGAAQDRLRFFYRLVKVLGASDHPHVVQAWLTGLNPELGDRVPLRLLREGDLEVVGPEILNAARAFASGG